MMQVPHTYFSHVLLHIYLQVNLDFYTREIISQSIQHPSPSCFVVAQRKIYSLMENDSFPRFIQSEQYKVLFIAASKPRGLGKHRKALRIKSTGDLIQHDSKPIILQSELSLHLACWWWKALHSHRLRNYCWQTLKALPLSSECQFKNITSDKTESWGCATDTAGGAIWCTVNMVHNQKVKLWLRQPVYRM